jgi:O-antigen/teichoic acid export membrane protein
MAPAETRALSRCGHALPPRIGGRDMSVGRSLVGATAWMAAGTWIEQAINFAVFVILARLLGADALGAVAMASVVVVLCEFLVRETFSDGLIAQEAPGAADRDAAFWLLVAAAAGLVALLVIGAAPLARLYDLPLVRDLVLALSPAVMLTALSAVPTAILRRDMRFRALSLRAIAGVLAGAVVALAMAVGGWGVWALVGQRLVLLLVNMVFAWVAVDWRPGLRATRASLARVGGFGGKVLGLRAAELSAAQAPILILGMTLGAGPTGLFSVAWRIVDILAFLVVVPIRSVAQPAFAAEARAGRSPGTLLMAVARYSGLLAFPVFAGIAAVSLPAIKVLFRADWAPAAPVLAVLAAVGAYQSIEKVQQSLCLAAGRPGPITLAAWGNVAMIAVLSALAVPYGLTAVACAVLAGYLLVWPFRLRIAGQIAGQGPLALLRPHLAPALAALAMAAVVTLVLPLAPARPILVLAIGIATGAVAYGLALLVFFRPRLAELWALAARRPAAATATSQIKDDPAQ